MNSSRRSFLGGILSVGAASLIIPTSSLLASPPLIVGDGIHDDWAGLQAALNGEPFSLRDKNTVIKTRGGIQITGGHFSVSRTIHLTRDDTHISHATFTARSGFKDDVLFRASAENCHLQYLHLNTQSQTTRYHLLQ